MGNLFVMRQKYMDREALIAAHSLERAMGFKKINVVS
jgi:hypothetical protein